MDAKRFDGFWQTDRAGGFVAPKSIEKIDGGDLRFATPHQAEPSSAEPRKGQSGRFGYRRSLKKLSTDFRLGS